MVTVVAAVAAPLVSAPPAAAAANPAPPTVPALQSWTGGTGTLSLTGSSRIVVNTADSALSADADTLAGDLSSITGMTLPVVTGTAPNPGDLFVSVDSTQPHTTATPSPSAVA